MPDSQSGPGQAPSPWSPSGPWFQPALQVVLLLGGFAALYWNVIADLIYAWENDGTTRTGS